MSACLGTSSTNPAPGSVIPELRSLGPSTSAKLRSPRESNQGILRTFLSPLTSFPLRNISCFNSSSFALEFQALRLQGTTPTMSHNRTRPAWNPLYAGQEGLTDILNSIGIRDLSSEIKFIGGNPIAVGPSCTVWRGKLKGSIHVAIKLRHSLWNRISRKGVHEYLQEAQLWSYAMHHEHVIPLLGVAGFEDSLPVAFISPWMDGGNLRTYLEAHPRAPLEPLLADVACGMSYLHSQGIVYGRLQMSTVLISDIGRAYLSCFVTASFLQRRDCDSTNGFDDKIGFAPLATQPTLQGDVFDFGNIVLKVNDLRQAPASVGTIDSGNSQPLPPHFPSKTLEAIMQKCLQEPPTRPSMAEVAHIIVQLAETVILHESNTTTSSPRVLKDISSEITKVGWHPVASGGYCDLYLGQRAGGEVIALKLVRLFGFKRDDISTARHRFLTEARLWAEFHHPRILELYGICERGSSAFFMVSPYLEHGNIIQYLSHDTDADRYQLLSEAAEGLFYLHQRQVVHGDLKGANILITASRNAVLADFGLSKISHEITTSRLQGAGSPRWMAPELVLATGKQNGPLKTPMSDIYAYGHVMLEVLGAKLPFFNLKEDIHVIVELIRGGRSPRPDGFVAERWLNDVTWGFSQLCTAIDSDERPRIAAVISFMHLLHGDTNTRAE